MSPFQPESLGGDWGPLFAASQELKPSTDTKTGSGSPGNRLCFRSDHFLLGRTDSDEREPGATFGDELGRLAARNGVSAQAHRRNDLDEFHIGKAGLQQPEKLTVTADNGDPVM
jgi:hypothetical protein